MKEGIHNIPMAEYLSDPCEEPSLSTGAVCSIYERTPLHAMREHPRLGKRPDKQSADSDLGSAVHALCFGGALVEFVGEVTIGSGAKARTEIAQDYKGAEAKAARDAIRAAGNIPMLTKDAPLLDAIHGSIVKFLATSELGIDLASGHKEQTLIWQESSPSGATVWCRARGDFFSRDYGIDLDLKTHTDADPKSWIDTTLTKQGYDVQLQLRHRALNKILGENENRISAFVIAEVEPPFACSLVALSPSKRAVADHKINKAIDAWRRGLDSGVWPAYSGRVHYAEATARDDYDLEARGAL